METTRLLPELAVHARNVHSQNGEDGIIEELARRLGIARGHCVEFGAWDGVHLSNTCNLIRNRGWSATLIEGSEDRFRDLERNMAPYPEVRCLRRWVEFEGPAALEGILEAQGVPRDFELLSIDVDGVDYHIFESLQKVRPRIVIIEFNPTIPNDVDFVQARDFGVRQGSSASSILALAHQKNYRLAASTDCNLILVAAEHFHAVAQKEPALAECRDDRQQRVYLFQGFDGTLITSRPLHLLWHEVKVGADRFQVVPTLLRWHPDSRGLLARALQKTFLVARLDSVGAAVQLVADRVARRWRDRVQD